MPLPDYINCKNKTISHCNYYMHNDCKGTCAYAIDIGGIGVESAHPSTFQGLEQEVKDESNNLH